MKSENILSKIIADKKIEVAKRKKIVAENVNEGFHNWQTNKIRYAHKNFYNMLSDGLFHVIAEIKRKSPSKGKIADINEPTQLAQEYFDAGATAISVLTDQKYFNGYLTDLSAVTQHLINQKIAILRKEFIIDYFQIYEAANYGANAVLLIASILKNDLKSFICEANVVGLDALVEIHNERELDLALNSDAKIIGINNRNLNNFDVNLDTSMKLKNNIPDRIVTIAESGISNPKEAIEYKKNGFNAVLIGESLVKSNNKLKFINQITKR